MDPSSSFTSPIASSDRRTSTPRPAIPQDLPTEHRERLKSLVKKTDEAPSNAVEALLQLGTELLNLDTGYLCRIHPGLGRQTVVKAVGSEPAMQEGETYELRTTFCRAVITTSNPVRLHNVPQQGWTEDEAYKTFGFRSYFGTKVLLGNQLYGTVCFANSASPTDPFTDVEDELLRVLAQQIEYILQDDGKDHPEHLSREGVERGNTLRQRVHDLSHVGGWELEVESQEMRWTDEIYDLYELPRSHDPTLESTFRYFDDESRSTLRSAVDRCIAEGTAYDLELPLITAQDTHRWVRARGVAHVKDGETVRVTGMLQDITEYDDVERERTLARNQFRRLVENAEPAVFMIDDDGTILVSEGDDLHDLTREPDELVGENVFDVFSDAPDVQRQVERALSGEAVRGRLNVGGTVLDVWHAPFEDQTGTVTGCVGMATNVTDQKHTQEALRKERDLLNRVFETSPLAIAVFDEDGEFIHVGGQAQAVLGLKQEEVEKRSFKDADWDITAPDGTPLTEHELPFARVKETEDPVMNAEHTIEWPDGRRRLLSVNGAPLHDDDGTFVGAVFHIDDITDRRQAKRNLEESERRFRSVFENAALGIALLNDDGHILDANPAFESMLGYDDHELDGRHFNTITHPEDKGKSETLYRDLVTGQTDRFQVEKRYLRKNGETFWGHLTVSRLDSPEETQVVALLEDIDTRKKQRDKLRQFRKVIDQAHEAVLILDGEPREKPGPPITYANPSFQKLTGYHPDEAAGESLQLLFGPDTESWVLSDLWDHVKDGVRHEGEAISYRKDGTPFVNCWSIAPVYDEEKTLTHWVSVLRDVTEKREMGKRLLEVQDEERRRIDKEMHDEMGGLLTTLQMTVELSRMEAESGKDITNRFEEIEDLVTRVSSVTRTISRRLHPRVLDDHGLAAALNSLKNDLREQYDLTIELHNEIEDEERLSTLVELTAFRVIQEALINVVRHAETDAVQVVINKVEKQLRVHVIDEGVGFDPEKESGAETYGLQGMAERIEHLNGDVEIDTAPGEGTRISATLPLCISSLPTE